MGQVRNITFILLGMAILFCWQWRLYIYGPGISQDRGFWIHIIGRGSFWDISILLFIIGLGYLSLMGGELIRRKAQPLLGWLSILVTVFIVGLLSLNYEPDVIRNPPEGFSFRLLRALDDVFPKGRCLSIKFSIIEGQLFHWATLIAFLLGIIQLIFISKWYHRKSSSLLDTD